LVCSAARKLLLATACVFVLVHAKWLALQSKWPESFSHLKNYSGCAVLADDSAMRPVPGLAGFWLGAV
jgi:hypothetical protein